MPGLHGVGTSEPVEQEEPAGQAVHCVEEPSPDTLLNVPSEHGSGVDARSSQYEPAVQTRHTDEPASCWNVPASHLAHEP